MVKAAKKKKYPKICAILRAKTEKEGSLSVDDCKEVIGWTEKPEGENWSEFALKDLYGRKIRLVNNPSNRPFRRPLADRYASEHLRGKWSLNLETIVIDCFGNVLQGQHRLIGLILGEQLRQLDTKQWGDTPLTFEVLMGYGVSPAPENANTYDLGASRKLDDVIYRHQQFKKDTTDKEQKKVSKALAGALRLVWLRFGGKQISFAPHFPHSEALEFYKLHPQILKAVTEIISLDNGDDGNERRVSSLISLNYTAALCYLMAKATDWEQALSFWGKFASGEGLKKGNPILTLRQSLTRMDTGGSKRDLLVGTVIKAWLLWIQKKQGSSKDIRVARKRDGDNFVLAEFPRIGGLDSDVEIKIDLSQQQRVLLNVLGQNDKEASYKDLSQATGLQAGTIGKLIMNETKQGKENPHSLASRGLVNVNQYEPEDGQKISPYMFSLTPEGKKLV